MAADSLSSPELRPLADLIVQVTDRRNRLAAEIALTDAALAAATRKIALGRMPILRMLTRRRVAAITQVKATLELQRTSLAERLESTAIDADFELSEASRTAFGELVQQFSRLRSCHVIWDISESERIDRVRARSAASEAVARHKVSFVHATLETIDSDFDSMRLCNANGGDLFVFPCFLAIRKSDSSLALIDVRQLALTIAPTRFIEEEVLPSDSERVGSAWARSNKDGSPDRRFANNYQIPVVQYGKLFLTSPTGLNEAYMFSNWASCESFGKVFRAYIETLPRRGKSGTEVTAPLIDTLPAIEIPQRPHVPSILSASAWMSLGALVLCGLGIGAAWRVGALTLSPDVISLRAPQSPAEVGAPNPSAPLGTSSEVERERIADVPSAAEPTRVPNSTGGASSSPLTTDEIIELQKKLKVFGFNVGTADGIVGRRTLTAVKSYQSTHGLPVTGVIDRGLFDHVMKQANAQ